MCTINTRIFIYGNLGRAGADGISGKDGKDGIPGLDGKNGIDGRDGMYNVLYIYIQNEKNNKDNI